MRIIAGKYKGIQLTAPVGRDTRPTADRVRQTLFDILMHAEWAGKHFIETATVLDAFAGTGALGLESLSRGAQQAYFFEKNSKTRSILEKNIQSCHAENISTLYKDVLDPPIAVNSCDLIFLDPPYHQRLIEDCLPILQKKQWIADDAVIITETAQDEVLDFYPPFTLLTERKIGKTSIKIWKVKYLVE